MGLKKSGIAPLFKNEKNQYLNFNLMRSGTLKGQEGNFLLLLYSYSSGSFHTVKELSEILGVSDRTIKRIISSLRLKGLIEVNYLKYKRLFIKLSSVEKQAEVYFKIAQVRHGAYRPTVSPRHGAYRPPVAQPIKKEIEYKNEIGKELFNLKIIEKGKPKRDIDLSNERNRQIKELLRSGLIKSLP